MTHQQGSLGGVLQTFMHQFGRWDCVYFITKMFTHRENAIYQQWTTYSLKPKSVSKMHFPGIWRSKFTDLANKTVKKTSTFGKKRLQTKVLGEKPNFIQFGVFNFCKTSVLLFGIKLLKLIEVLKLTQSFLYGYRLAEKQP